LLLVIFVFGALSVCEAQDVPFKPRHDGLDQRRREIATPTPDTSSKVKVVYSFSRFGDLFKLLCQGLEADRRRARVFDVAKAGLREDRSCPSCRAFYRQLGQSCKAPKQQMVKPTPTPTPTVTADPQVEQAAEPAQEPSVTPTPTPTLTPQPERHPRTDVVDTASRLSISLYDMEPGEGSPYRAVRAFETRLNEVKDLTPGERDYYGVLMSYLMSAWAGREQELVTPRPLSREDIADLFQ